MGRVVEATRNLEAITAERLGAGAPAPWLEAQAQAAKELPSVRERIATIVLRIRGAGAASGAVVEIDESPVPLDREAHAVDPGSHRVVVRAGHVAWERKVRVGDGEERLVDVSLVVEAPGPRPRTQRTAGFVLLGAGAASLVAGTVFAVSALSTSNRLDDACGRDRRNCPPSERDAIDRVKAHSLLADLTLGGGVLLGLGGGALILFESAPRSEAPTLRIVGAPGGAGLGLELAAGAPRSQP
jgi:hypothetical protein